MPPVNRPRKSKGPFPPCFYQKHGAFYLVKANKWMRLGSDYGLALAEYARIMQTGETRGMPKLIDEVLAKVKPRLADSTAEQYAYAAKLLKKALAQFEPHEVKARHMAKIQDDLSSTPNMANRVISFARLIFVDAVKRQLVDSNPCVGIPRLPEEKRKRLISDKEWMAIYEQAGARLKVIMRLQYLTGQRIGDVLAIKRSQITDEGLFFRQQKTGAQLLVRWTPDLKAAIEEAKAITGDVPSLTLLRSRTGGPPDYRSVAEQFARAAEAAGVEDVRLNDGRAKAGTETKRQGKSARALLGHASETMTARYLRDKEIPEVEGPSFRQGLDIGQK